MTTFRYRGRRIESEIRKLLREHGFYVFVHGISTPGVDIIALKYPLALFLEVKSTSQEKLYVKKEQLNNLLEEAKKFVESNPGFKCRCFLIVKMNRGYAVIEIKETLENNIKVTLEDARYKKREIIDLLTSERLLEEVKQ